MTEEVSRFLQALKSGTQHIYNAGLAKFLSYYRSSGEGETISDFLDALEEDLSLPRRQKRRVGEETIRGFIDYLREEKLTPKTIRTYVSAVQSLCTYYGLRLSTRYVDVPSSRPRSDKYPWTLDKVADFIGRISDSEIKAIAVMIFQSGLSVSDLLALQYRDIKFEYERGIVPLCLDLSRIKTDVPFMTFIGSWGSEKLRRYLAGGESLKFEDQIFTVSHRTIDYHFERLAKRWFGEYEGFNPCRPHSLRSGFRTILSEAGMPYDIVEFFMGHQLPEQVRVYHSRTRDGWRAIYKEYEPAITPLENMW